MSRNNKDSVLIIGYIPQPIGGLSIHVQRLLQNLNRSGVKYNFIDYLKDFNPFKIGFAILSHKVIHLHSANPYLRLAIGLYCKLLNKILIITFHGNLGRYTFLRNQADFMAVRVAKYPIVLNRGSYKIAKTLNKNSRFFSAFIPPPKDNLQPDIYNDIMEWKDQYDQIYCTNAFKYKLDKYNNEIYGISDLIAIFKLLPLRGLILSDPSGEYLQYLKKRKLEIPPNIFIIDFPHPFYEIIKLSDAFIRATSTDGDSLSVKEAMFAEKPTFASDCIARPEGCIYYKNLNFQDLLEKIEGTDIKKLQRKHTLEDGSISLINLYKELL